MCPVLAAALGADAKGDRVENSMFHHYMYLDEGKGKGGSYG